MPKRIILHLDMDAFFASVEERDYPEFHGFPIVVGADPEGGQGRGVVSTANYEARKYGVGSAMPIGKAWRLCKKGEEDGGKACIFFGGNFTKYAEESRKIMMIARDRTDTFEQAGIDEAYLELRNSSFREAEVLAKSIQRAVHKATRLTCSIGIGPNKLIAKIASDFKKPREVTVVEPKDVQRFLDPLSVRVIPGIGPKTGTALKELGAQTIKELRGLSRTKLRKHFGTWGESMYERACGIDTRPVEEHRPIKSIGHEKTFPKDVGDPTTLLMTLRGIAHAVAGEVEEANVTFQKVTIVVRFADFATRTRQTTLAQPVHDATTIERAALRLFLPFLDARENPQRQAFRLIGVRVGRFKSEQPRHL